MAKEFRNKIEFTIIDNSGPVGQPKLVGLDFLDKIRYNKDVLKKQLYEATDQAISQGRITKDKLQEIYGATLPGSTRQGISQGQVNPQFSSNFTQASGGEIKVDKLLEKQYGVTKLQDAHNAAYIGKNGKLLGDLADHQKSAVEMLNKMGIPTPDEYEAVKTLQKQTGLIRLHVGENEINIDTIIRPNEAQLNIIKKLAKEYPDSRIVYDITNLLILNTFIKMITLCKQNNSQIAFIEQEAYVLWRIPNVVSGRDLPLRHLKTFFAFSQYNF